MISKYTASNKVVWVDLENPTREEIREIMNTYGLEPEVAEDLLDPTIHTRADIYKNFMYFVFHFPLHTHKKNQNFNKQREEIDFVIGKDFIITIHYSPIEALISFGKSFETDALLNQNRITKNPGSLFVHILYSMYKAVQEKCEDIHSTLISYEDKIFGGKEKEMVLALSDINRILIYFKSSLNSHKDLLDLFEKTGLHMFGKDFESQILYIQQEYKKSERAIFSAKDYADELRATNNSLLSTKQNEVMKLLAIISFITFPLTLLSSIFGMNTHFLPIVGNKYDFEIIISIMIAITASLFMFFKKKNWL